MQKIIHYCWFGDKPLTKMAKKCIKSWKKFFPDYEIKEWNEKNFDVNICNFVKEAYDNKKWAFVSDYARLYALYNDGGIYFDTDMEVIKKCDFLCNDDLFIGYEENKIIAAGVIGVNDKDNKYISELLNWYNKQEHFNIDNLFDYAIPKIITKIFSKYSTKTIDGINIIDKGMKIYPEEYFYPINYNYSKRNFTKKTCMVHYYNATWAPKEEKIAIWILRKFGIRCGNLLLKIYYRICKFKNYLIRFVKRRVNDFIKFYSIQINYRKRVKSIEEYLERYSKSNVDYIMIYHPDWIGLLNVAKDNFKNVVPLKEQYTKKEAKLTAKVISKRDKKLVIFNGFAKGWEYIASELKLLNCETAIKVLWHGSNALLSEEYDFEVFMKILNMYNKNIIDEIGFVKKSMYEFYNAKGYKCSFVMNYINIQDKEVYCRNNTNFKTKVGLYCSGDRWVKNTYNQISAISLLQNVVLDCLPLTDKVKSLANEFNLLVTGASNNLQREELFKRMSQNDVNLYVTFTECAPLLPLESLELGVPCITGDNHHYFEGTELEKYLVVNKEDNIIEIYNKLKYVLENKETILKLYNEWKKTYIIQAKKSIEKFIR